MNDEEHAKRFVIRGRVQGVGYRWFARQSAVALRVRGWTRNLDNGDVEVYAVGSIDQLKEFQGTLFKGPRHSEIRGIEESDAAVEKVLSFRILR